MQPEIANAEGRPAASGEQWLGRNASEKRRLWERLNPRHRKLLHVLARALALRQNRARMPASEARRLWATLEELERLAGRIETLLAAILGRGGPPPSSQ